MGPPDGGVRLLSGRLRVHGPSPPPAGGGRGPRGAAGAPPRVPQPLLPGPGDQGGLCHGHRQDKGPIGH